MDTRSLSQDLKLKNGIYDLFTPTIQYRYDASDVYEDNLSVYEVTETDEMRIDLIFQNMYEIGDELATYSYEDIDVILTINNIVNPLNIKRGTLLKYPPLGEIQNFRIDNAASTQTGLKSVQTKLGVPNKSTRTDKTRKAYQDNGYQLPPSVRKAPKVPVSVEGGNYKLGGLQT